MTERTPRVSIITPTYNQLGYITRCIDSVRAQTFGDWEMLVVDDGSTDGTPDRVDAYADPRIRLIRMPHRGMAALHESYNTALAAARGDLTAILEGDDAWPADKLAVQVPLFDDPDTTIAWGASIYMDADDRPLRRVGKMRTARGANTATLGLPELFRRLTIENILAPTLTVMVRTAALRATGGFLQGGARMVVDLPTWLVLSATQPGSARYIDHVLGHYRVHAAQTTNVRLLEMVSDYASIVESAVARLDDHARARVGWSERMQQNVRSNTELLRAMALLQLGRFDDARTAFAALRRDPNLRHQRTRLRIGALSATLRTDLFRPLRAIRNRVRS